MTPDRPRTRIAPTPSGFLHAGNLFSFVLTWLLAKRQGGTVRLRIDDMDAARMRTVYIEDIFQTLDWIGLQPDEGPSGVADFLQHHSQQCRMHLYGDILEKLMATGKVYACNCSRKTILSSGSSGTYPGTCRRKNIPTDDPQTALRVMVPDGIIQMPATGHEKGAAATSVNLAGIMGDFVIRRKDGLPAYQVTSLADDLHYQINMIVRGADLVSSTAGQLYLSGLLQEKTFSDALFLHHRLMKNEKGEKLSKSAGHTSLQFMRARGFSKAQMLAQLAMQFQLPSKPYGSLADLLETFSTLPLFPNNLLE